MNLRDWLARLDAWDRRVSAAVVRGPTLPHWVAQMGAHGGDLWLWALITLLAWRRMTPARRREWSLGLGAAAGITYFLKQQTRRRRPHRTQGLYGGGADVYSFPSGHASRLGVLLVWAARSGTPWFLPAVHLTLWTLWSRMRLGIHTVGDVVVGLGLGVAIARLARRISRSPSIQR